MGRRPPAPRRRRGGDRIQASHPIRLRLALIAAAAVAAGAVALLPLLTIGSLRKDELLAAAVALAAVVFPLAGESRLLPWAIALLGGCVLLATVHGDASDAAVAVAAALLLLVGECTSAAGDLKRLGRIERLLALRLVLRLAAEAAAAGLLAALVLAAGSLGVRADLATFAIGLMAAVALLAIVAVLAGRAR